MMDNTQGKGKAKVEEAMEEENTIAYKKGVQFYNAELFEAYNELQRVARDFETTFEAPEIIVVGTQSAGKSSLIEALVGFRFNYVGTGETITRRPLVVQMMRTPDYEEPYCLFLPEKDDGDCDSEEGVEVAVSGVAQEIKRRTLQFCRKPNDFYDVPIMLRVLYKYCANLTIIDMPGFVVQGEEESAEKIRQMARSMMKPSNRIIVCLEDSGRDWNLSIARPIVQSIDPLFERTILVATKFDQRLKELIAHPGIVNKYLGGGGFLPKLPFLFQLPISRDVDGLEFCEQIENLAIDDITLLFKLGMEKRFEKQIGFPNIKNYLETLLLKKYRESIPKTFEILNNKCVEIEAELKETTSRIEALETRRLRGRASDYVVDLVQSITRYLKGTIKGDPATNGQSLSEEREEADFTGWKGLTISEEDLDEYIENANEKLYGGAQYYRLQREFEAVIRCIEFPPTTISEVATALGLDEMKPNPDYDWAACDIAQNKIDNLYNPFLEIFCNRLKYIMIRLFYIVVRNLEDQEFPTHYDLFFQEIRRLYIDFINQYAERLLEDLKSVLEQISGYIIEGGPQTFQLGDDDDSDDYDEVDLLQPSKEQTGERVRREMGRHAPRCDPFRDLKMRDVRVVDASVAKAVMEEAARHFIAIRDRFASQFKRSCNVQFWVPMYNRLLKEISREVVQKTDDEITMLFNANSEELLEKRDFLQKKLRSYIKSRERFASVAARVKNAQIS